MTTAPAVCYSGWDIGGAHLKVARCDNKGRVISAIELPCPLWQGVDQLRRALRSAFDSLANANDRHFVTMTGELVDVFANRQTGVSEILNCLIEYISTDKLSIYSREGWLSVDQARVQWQAVASMNWLATASFAAASVNEGLLVDIGTTTTDVVPLQNGLPQPQGYDDYQRQQLGELAYTGAIRTPLIALTEQAPFEGRWISLAAEVFATTGDCWCLLNLLDSDQISDRSADGMPWYPAACEQRLARLLGTDADHGSSAQWQLLARWFAEKQLEKITHASLQVLSAHPSLDPQSPVIGAGIGRFIAHQLADRLQRPYLDLAMLYDNHKAAADFAPATALALLAQQQFTQIA